MTDLMFSYDRPYGPTNQPTKQQTDRRANREVTLPLKIPWNLKPVSDLAQRLPGVPDVKL